MTSPRLLFAGGGTGGHVFPAVAVAQAVLAREPSARIRFALPSGRSNFLKGSPWETVILPAPRLGGPPWRWPLIGVGGLGALASLTRLLAEFRPQAVVGTGGYASAGAVLAARFARVPVMLLEPNAVAGRANRFLSRFADEVAAAWEFDYEPWSGNRHPFSSRIRLVVTGNPVRAEILALAGEPGRGEGLLVFGGSLGATPINRAASEAVPEIARVFPGLPIRHVTGKADAARIAAHYLSQGVSVDVRPFLSDMRMAYRDASVVVCRAGGNTLAEVLALGKAAVIVPYPKAMEDHQRANALHAAQRGAAVMVEEKDLTPVRLAAEVSRLLGDVEARQALRKGALALARPDAARVVAGRVLALARGKASHAA